MLRPFLALLSAWFLTMAVSIELLFVSDDLPLIGKKIFSPVNISIAVSLLILLVLSLRIPFFPENLFSQVLTGFLTFVAAGGAWLYIGMIVAVVLVFWIFGVPAAGP